MTRTLIGSLMSIDGRDVHVRVDGPEDGRVLLLVHGFSCSMHWYDDLVVQLSDRYRLIRVDLHGHGSTGGDTGLDAPAQGRMVADLLGRLGVNDVLAIGHSFGCDVVLAAAALTDRVSRIVLMGQAPAIGPGLSTLPKLGVIMTLPGVGPLLHRLAPRGAVVRSARRGFAPTFVLGRALAQLIVADQRAMSALMYREVLRERPRRLGRVGLDEQVRMMGLPTLVILGGRDQWYPVPPSEARYAAAGARVEVVAESGHCLQVERPADVVELLDDFVSE